MLFLLKSSIILEASYYSFKRYKHIIREKSFTKIIKYPKPLPEGKRQWPHTSKWTNSNCNSIMVIILIRIGSTVMVDSVGNTLHTLKQRVTKMLVLLEKSISAGNNKVYRSNLFIQIICLLLTTDVNSYSSYQHLNNISTITSSKIHISLSTITTTPSTSNFKWVRSSSFGPGSVEAKRTY